MTILRWPALFLLVLSLFFLPEAAPLWGDPDQCPELVTDYSQYCHDWSTRCGAFCFYAVCLDCENEKHQDHTEHCHDRGEDDEECHQDHSFHYFEISPCIDWFWHLYDPGEGRSSRNDRYSAPHLGESLDLGLVPDDFAPPESTCVTDQNRVDVLPGGLKPVSSGPAVPGPHGTSSDGHKPDQVANLLESHPVEVTLSDFSHLPSTPGDLGAPTLLSVTKVTDRSVLLEVLPGSVGGVLQYRYWSYNGLREISEDEVDLLEVAPSDFRVPFVNLEGEVRVEDGLRGIVSFQVRSLDEDGVPLGSSNIQHQVVGMADFHTIRSRRDTLSFGAPLPKAPLWGTPLPPLEGGLLRPVRPAISALEQVDGVGIAEVQLDGFYPETVQYRWWPHSGFLPTIAFDEWKLAEVSGDLFTVYGVGVESMVEDAPLSFSVFNFQVRLVDGDGVPGDPSDVKPLLFWSGEYPLVPTGAVSTPPPTPDASNFQQVARPTSFAPAFTRVPPTPIPEGAFLCEPGGVPTGDDLMSDCRALLGLAPTLSGLSSLNWDWDLPLSEWDGVVLGGSPLRVHGLELSERGLLGTVPWGLGKLKEIRVLDLRDNHLLGTIPVSIINAHYLERLDLRDNRLVGNLPEGLSALHHLKEFRVDRNGLDGVLWGRFNAMDELNILGLADNYFYGSVPPILVDLLLSHISLAGNDFTGCVPVGLQGVADNDISLLLTGEMKLC